MAAALVAALMLAGCGSAEDGESAPERQEALGETAVLRFAVRVDRPLAEGANDLHLEVVEAASGTPLVGAKVDVAAQMPAMGHASQAPAAIEDLGAGNYAVRSLVLPMPGRWQVRFAAAEASTSDRVTFTYDVP